MSLLTSAPDRFIIPIRNRGVVGSIFGVLAITAGLAIIVSVIAGVDLWPIGVIIPSIVVIGWVIFYWVVVRPAPTGVKRPEESPRHDDV